MTFSFRRPLAKRPLARIVLDTFFGTPMTRLSSLCCHPGKEFFVGKTVQWDNICLWEEVGAVGRPVFEEVFLETMENIL